MHAAVLEAAANSIVITDPKGAILWTNRAFSDLTGYTPDEAWGKNPRLLSSGKQDNKFYSNLWQTITTGKVWHGEIINRRKDGTLYTEEMTITPVRSDSGEITHFVAIKQDVSERIRVEQQLRESETFYRQIISSVQEPIIVYDRDLRYRLWNPAMEEMTGVPLAEAQGKRPADLFPFLGGTSVLSCLERSLAGETILDNEDVSYEFPRSQRSGWVLGQYAPLRDANGQVIGVITTLQEVTKRKQAEQQFLQAQKMEAVGRLAGGVAHDFNNALGVITGYSELLQLALPEGETLRKQAEEIQKAGRRAASLTRQLLAFSRKQTIQPVVLDLNSIVTDIEKMLRRLIGEDIDLVIVGDPELKRVKADRGQIEQVLMNLAVNARDAMPQGGKLLIETSNAELDESYVRQHSYAKAGRYVKLATSDNGCGMSAETRSHIFEPFFTTKELGKGTGLGLSTVYGIVKQSEGYIWVSSEVGKGTTFEIYLPQVEAAADPIGHKLNGPLRGGTETILLAEDEESLRTLTRALLESSGYRVVEAQNAKSAIEVAQRHQGPIHLLLTDVIMPGMSGRELANNLMQSHPKLKILFMSGYTHDLISQHRTLNSGPALLEKPFDAETLLTKVRAVLDEKLSNAAGAS